MAVNTLFPQDQSVLGVKVSALAAALSDTEPEDDSDDERILNAFTATVDSTNGCSKP